MKRKVFFLVVSIVWISCENSDNVNPEVPQDVIDKSLELFNGNVIEQESSRENGIESWQIKVENQNGSIVKFYWTKSGQTLIRIEGINSPFNYNINPGNNLINFSTAQTVAKSAVKNDVVSKWKLEQDEDFLGNWIYSFQFDDISITVVVDATNGDILETN